MKPEAFVPRFTQAAVLATFVECDFLRDGERAPASLPSGVLKNLAASGFSFLMDAANSLPPK
ncbi:MAG: hypothetical protein WCQ57_02095 [Verrucomicrobiota bacterium]